MGGLARMIPWSVYVKAGCFFNIRAVMLRAPACQKFLPSLPDGEGRSLRQSLTRLVALDGISRRSNIGV